jgi:DedD protein
VDTHLKERLVGAAVLVAVAVILIPEMLSGPSGRDAAPAGAARTAEEGGVRTYTIDLGERARSGANEPVPSEAGTTAAIEETPAPPPEDEQQPSVPVVAPAATESVANVPVVVASTEPTPAERPVAAVKAPPASTPAPAPEAAATVRSSDGQKLPWVVQIGSFARQDTADRLSQDLKRRGYASFVVPFKPGAQTLYRVRVGPMRERSEADAIVQKLKREGTAATVVANG